MSTSSLLERAAFGSGTIAAHCQADLRVWEKLFAYGALVLSTNAVVPLVFNPDLGGTGRTESVRDPLGHPAWFLISLFVVLAMFRFGSEILAALIRNPAIGVMCFLAVFSSAWSAVPRSTLQAAIELVFSTLFGLYAGVRFGIGRLVTMLGWITAAILVLSVVFALAVPKYGIDHVRGNAWRGVFGTKNELGRMMVIGGVVWAVRMFAGEIGRVRGTAAIVAFALVGFASGARTALGVAGLMAGVLVLVWLLSQQTRKLAPIKGLVVSGIALSALLLLTNVKLLLHIVGADYSLTGRVNIWDSVWSAIRLHPWLGYGFEAFWRGIYGPSLEVWRASHNTPPHSHNGFLDILLSFGAVGLAVFLLAFAVAWRRALAQLHRGQGSSRTFPLVFLSLLLLYNLTESGLIATRSLEWIVFAWVAAALAKYAAPDTVPWDGTHPTQRVVLGAGAER